MEAFETALLLLPETMRTSLQRFDSRAVEELRLREGHRPSVVTDGKEIFFSEATVSVDVLNRVLERATGASLHAVSAQIAEGFVSYGGLRIGICGTAVLRDGRLTGLRDVSSLAIRIPHELRGICNVAVREICADSFQSTLIISPPGGGKTTALRDVIRSLSDMCYRVCVIDERRELSAGTLGAHCDVLTGTDKASGGMMLLRGMNPQIIAMDEISKPDDIVTVSEIYGCGVMLLASAHARDIDDLRRRKLYRSILDEGIFNYIIEIHGRGSSRTYTVKRWAM